MYFFLFFCSIKIEKLIFYVSGRYYTYIYIYCFFDYTPEAAFYLHLKHCEHFGNPQLACLVKIHGGELFGTAF